VPCWHAVDRDDKQVWEMAGHKDMAVIAMSGSLLFAWMCVDELSDKMHLFLRLRHAFEGRLCVSAQIELICPLRVPDASRRLMCKWLGSGRIGMTPVVLVSALLSQCAHAQQTQGRYRCQNCLSPYHDRYPQRIYIVPFRRPNCPDEVATIFVALDNPCRTIKAVAASCERMALW